MLGVSQNNNLMCGVSVSIQIPTIMFNVHMIYACIHYLQTWLGHMLGTGRQIYASLNHLTALLVPNPYPLFAGSYHPCTYPSYPEQKNMEAF